MSSLRSARDLNVNLCPKKETQYPGGSCCAYSVCIWVIFPRGRLTEEEPYLAMFQYFCSALTEHSGKVIEKDSSNPYGYSQGREKA